MPEPIHLRGGGVSLLIWPGDEPEILHWGADLGDRNPGAAAFAPPVPGGALDESMTLGLVPQESSGWLGRPALRGHRDGKDFSPRLRLVEHGPRGEGWELLLADEAGGLEVRAEIALGVEGMLRMRHEVHNTGSGDYALLGLDLMLPLASRARELLDLTGRWTREQQPQREAIRQGTWVRSGRHGRTGHDSSLLIAAGTPGFANRRGEVWAIHLGFSGDRESFVERSSSGRSVLGAGELLRPGEIVLAAGERYETPWLYAAYSCEGLDGIGEEFHHWLRSRATHPRSPRPVTLNTWEAVYFDHDLATLTELAAEAAALGVERFVLDDGWFVGRRSDRAGLGDWRVDQDVWPGGLHALIGEVIGRGMEFGLWVEPEMVSLDSELARVHPDWIAGPGHDRIPLEWRHQQVLDLLVPEVWRYVYDNVDALLDEYPISYLKWDQNRDLLELGHRGRASTHAQTLALYRLIDALREAHPGVEIESCSSGGGRVDLGILERTDRVWPSDTNDALERQAIQRWTGAVLPPELIGTHVGPARSHTTGRVHALSFRAITAMFGSFGVEWDLGELAPRDRAELRHAIELYKTHRGLLHSGRVVHADLPDPAFRLHGVVAADGGEALVAFVALGTAEDEVPGAVPIPGLVPERDYRVSVVFPVGTDAYGHRSPPAWLSSGLVASGRFLGAVGIPMPVLHPEHAILLHLVAA